MKRLILSVMTISLAGFLFLGSTSKAVAGWASVDQQLQWHAACVTAWRQSWLNRVCSGWGVSAFIVNDKLACLARGNIRCPNNKGGTLRMYQWENLYKLIPNARYCVLNNGKGKFFQKGQRPSNCQVDNW